MSLKDAAFFEKVMANAHECAGCLIWTASVNSAGVPVCRHDGSNVGPVRRHIWKAMGRMLDKRSIVPKCKEPLCVEPSHLIQENRGRKVGHKQTTAARKKMAEIRRSMSVLTQQDVDAIRASDEIQRVLAERHGISRSQVRFIQNGTCWQDTNSPFWGLQA